MITVPKLPGRIRARRAALEAQRQGKAAELFNQAGAGVRTETGTHIPANYARLLMLGIALLLAYYDVFNPNQKSPLALVLASLVFAVSCLPMILFLSRGKTSQVPVFECHGLFYALTFGFAGFLPIPQIMGSISVNEAELVRALAVTLMGMLALLAAYYLASPLLLKGFKPLRPSQGLSYAKLETLGWLSCAGGVIIDWVGRQLTIATLGQFSLNFYILGFFLLLVMTLEKRANLFTRVAVLTVLLPMQLLYFSGLSNGQLLGTVTLIGWISLVIFRVRGRIPIFLLTGAFVFFLIFQPVKFYVRSLAWGEGVQLGPLETLQVYADGFRQTYGSASAMMASRKENFDNSFDRINHLATTAAIIQDTPSAQPYLWGATYMPLLTKWIPRAIWKEKPYERLGNEWASRYGYLGQNDSTTSFNLPWLPEMYMNFGLAGVIGIMFLLGLMFRLLWVWLMGASEGPAEYAMAIVYAQSLVFAESNFSLMTGGIIIFAIILWFTVAMLQVFGVYNAPIIRNKRPRSRTEILDAPINENPA